MFPDDFGRLWHGPFPFDRREIIIHAPREFGVYQILAPAAMNSTVAYIGIATGETIRGRLLRHVSGNGNWALARIADPATFQFIYYECDSLSAQQIEAHIVTTNKPPFNVRPEYQDFIPSIAVH